jgi:hypothetical protein
MNAFDGPSWTREHAEGPSLFILTGGQTRPSHPLRVETLLAARNTTPTGQLGPEAARAMALCRGQPSSVAEIAALINVPVQITKVLLSRLMDAGALVAAEPTARAPQHDIALLEAVRDGLRKHLGTAAAS